MVTGLYWSTMILKIFASLILSLTTFAAAFQYGGIKHDITSQVGTASPIIMNAASTQVQRITGSTAQTLRLPSATTLRAGYWYNLINENSSAVTVQDSSAFTIGTISGGSRDAPVSALLYLTSNDTSGGPWTFGSSSASSGSGSAITKSISQASHGLSVGMVVRYTSTTSKYIPSIASSDADSEVYGIVSSVADANNFSLTTAGYVTGLTIATSGTAYYLSPYTYGGLTVESTSTAGFVNKPVLLSDSTSSGFVLQSRGVLVSSSGSSGSGSFYNGYQNGISGGCATTSTSYTDLSACTNIALVQLNASGITCSQNSTLPSISCTLPSTGYYSVKAIINFENNGAGQIFYGKLVNGSATDITVGNASTPDNTYDNQLIIEGTYNATSTSETFIIKTAVSGGTTTVSIPSGPGGGQAITWVIEKI